jgi:hypothetical protein
MITVFILLISAILVWVIIESGNVFELGTPATDSDILEMLEKSGVDYSLEQKWNSKFILKTSFRSKAPYINQTQYSILFPYYIEDVGIVPIWYKSAGKIKQMFEEKISASKYTLTKRDKLGLK